MLKSVCPCKDEKMYDEMKVETYVNKGYIHPHGSHKSLLKI